MKILDLVCSEGRTGFFFDDQLAIKNNAISDGSMYFGKVETAGFLKVRQAGESISVMFILEDGSIAYGDCVAVQYSGAAGRAPLFLFKDYIGVIENEIKPLFVGRDITTFRDLTKIIDDYRDSNGNMLHTAIRYGISQAILDMVAKANNKLMVDVIAEEYKTQISNTRIPIFTQSGDNRYDNVDKMLLKEVPILPHALINNVEKKLGTHGEKLEEYLKWLMNRIDKVDKNDSYNPIIQLDVYGTIGVIFDNDLQKVADYIKKLSQIVYPYKLKIEGPIDLDTRENQIESLSKLTKIIDEQNINVDIVADEWCNTYEDVIDFADNKAGHMIQIKSPDVGSIDDIVKSIIYCKEHGLKAYLGGSCNETDLSATISVHVGMATCADQFLARPGMGVDEAYMIAFNEMNRIIALKNR